jgi:hypothetical protein
MNRTSLTLVIPLILLTALARTPITVIENAFAGNGHGGIPTATLVKQRRLAIRV